MRAEFAGDGEPVGTGAEEAVGDGDLAVCGSIGVFEYLIEIQFRCHFHGGFSVFPLVAERGEMFTFLCCCCCCCFFSWKEFSQEAR